MTPQTGTQAIDRAARLLTLVVQSEEPRSFTSLAEDSDLAKSTTSRLLQALERHHLVRRDRDGAYRPGPLFTGYAARHDPVDDLVQVAEPTLQRMGDAVGETVNLSVPRGETVVQVAQVDSTYRLSATNWLDVDTPPHCSALGKVFYAYGTLPLPTGRLERRTGRTLTSRTALERDLAQVVRRGFAVTHEELEPGLSAIAAPVRHRDGAVIAAVSVSGPTTRIEERIDELSRLLVAETKRLSAALGYRPGKARKDGAA
ncbi:MAG: helix-turn-helix domain-containing protein [Micromonosporaceae bacterium]|nr:helix-turn-helix domain-containing protein [Micromonosporaceae bacterium]